MRVPISFGIKPEGKAVLTALADEMDVSRAALVRILINEALRARGITRKSAIALLRDAA